MTQFSLSALLVYTPLFISGMVVTLVSTACAIIFSFPLGLAFALVRVSPGLRPLRVVLTMYVEFVRNLPLLIILYVIYFGLPSIGIRWDGITSGIVALTLSSTAFATEIFRGGLAAIGPGQALAAASLGMRPYQAFCNVTFPQVIRICFPALGNQVIQVLLGSSLLSVVGAAELMYQTQSIGSMTFRYFEVFTVAGVLYAVAVQLIAVAWRGGERLLRQPTS